MAFYENYVQLCNEVGKSPSAVAIELKLGKPSVSRWKTGTKPRDTTVLKVANYFGVTVEELMSDTPSAGIKKERPADGEAPDQDKLLEIVRDSQDMSFLLKVMDEVNKSMQKLK